MAKEKKPTGIQAMIAKNLNEAGMKPPKKEDKKDEKK